MPLPILVKLGPRTPEKRSVKLLHLLKIAQRKHAKSLITQPWINWFRSNFVQSLNALHPKCCKNSRSRGHRSRSQRDITCAKIRKNINNSAGIALFPSNFVQTLITWRLMYHELSRSTGQRLRSQRDITYQHRKRYNSGTDKLLKVKLGENYLTAERNTLHGVKVIRSNI